MASRLFASVLFATVTAFQFGFHSGVINQPRVAMSKCDEPLTAELSLPECIPMDDWQWGTFVSLFLLGGIIGGLSGGHLSTTYGRRRILILNNVAFISTGLLLGLAPSVPQLYLGRFVAGLGAGIGTVVVPLYISEISPVARRGSLGSLNQLSIVIGVLLSQVAGMFLSTREGWRILLALTIGPSILQIALIPFSVETPKWLSSHGLVYDARQSLAALRGKDANIEDELAELMSSAGNNGADDDVEASTSGGGNNSSSADALIGNRAGGGRTHVVRSPATITELFSTKALRRPLMAAFGLQLAQQFSGINAAVFYSTDIFSKTYSAKTAIMLTLVVSVVNLIMTLISTSLIEKLGRRSLLLAAQIGMAAASTTVVLASRLNLGSGVIVLALTVFVGSFGIGLGSIPWLILPELVPSYAVGSAASICTAINWASAFTVAFFFPSVVAALGLDVFAVFALLLVGFIGFTYNYVPETKGLTVEEVAAANHFE
ncbi:Solute carrier 2, facilitated glucose transporter member 3 [Irineochytrium annulatum]|nr:Solute carrier 2, facilitated glucose transporter member 3 [Irineochytrium annulatum]